MSDLESFLDRKRKQLRETKDQVSKQNRKKKGEQLKDIKKYNYELG